MIVSVKIRNYVALKQCEQVHNSGLLFSLLAIQWTMFFTKHTLSFPKMRDEYLRNIRETSRLWEEVEMRSGGAA